LLINASKYHCDFIIEFFFSNPDSTPNTEEEYRNILVGGAKTKKSNVEIVTTNSNKTKEKEKSENEIDYPVYFKHVRINETQLAISFFLADNSPFVILHINKYNFRI
jgi:hypothetical protein